MKKRQRNKLMKKFLSEDEMKVIELFKSCDHVWFTKHNLPNLDEATTYCAKVNVGYTTELKRDNVYNAKKGKVEVSAFFPRKEVVNND